jgi:23S rRNA pseudouridine1911/1915/1917 synthase
MNNNYQQTFKFLVECNEQGCRLDKFLATKLTDFSRTKIKKLIESKNFYLNNILFFDCSYALKENDELTIHLPMSEEEHNLKPYEIELKIIYEDDYLIVIDKPAGLTVHPGAGNFHDTLVNALVHKYGAKLSQLGGNTRPGIVHRLDKDTSGLMVVAKDDVTHAKLSKLLADRKIKRTYWAIVYGVLTPLYGKIETNIARSRSDRTKMMVVREGGRVAITMHKVLKEYGNGAISLVECELQTGRTHQIRVHLTHKKHPIVGDQTYGIGLNHNLNVFAEDLKKLIRSFPRQALHAKKLEFIHPITQEEISLISELPNDIANLMDKLETL